MLFWVWWVWFDKQELSTDEKTVVGFFLFFCFKFSAFTLKAPHFTSSWPLRCSPAAPPAGLCCCLSDHHCRERRLRRQRGPTDRNLWQCARHRPGADGWLLVGLTVDSRPSTRRAWGGLGDGTRSCVVGTAAHRHEASFTLPMRCFRLPAACSSERLTSWTVGLGVKPRSIILEFGAWSGAAPVRFC